MAFSTRSVLRASRAANFSAASRAAAPSNAVRFFSATRGVRVSDTANKKSVVREKEVPVTNYGAGQAPPPLSARRSSP
ncbi:hypothetical protein TgHK011_002657 [Trichoderma gracile]|nr:hypothetical protein TgHK011_002657 [Trichoderma gracile]